MSLLARGAASLQRLWRCRASAAASDEALLEAALRGCRKSASQLYVRTEQDVYRFLSWMGLDRNRAADALHDVFERVLDGRLAFDAGKGNAKAFLLGVARFRALKVLGAEPASGALEEGLDETADGDMPEMVFARHQSARQVRAWLHELPVHQREVLVLCDMADLGYKEAAHLLQVPLGTVQSRLMRARARLRALCEQQGVSNESW